MERSDGVPLTSLRAGTFSSEFSEISFQQVGNEICVHGPAATANQDSGERRYLRTIKQ